MTWGAVGSAAIGTVGGALLGGGGEEINPMDAIPDFLKGDYKRLAGQVGDIAAPEYYQGQLIADQNPWLQQALGGMGDWGGSMGGDIMNSMYGAGQAGLGGIGRGMDYLTHMQRAGPNQFQYDQDTYDQSFGNLTGGLQNAFDVGARNMQQQFDWGELPGLNMSGALGGAQGSTKQYQQGALGQAMTNQNIQNFGTNMWQNAANRANEAAMTGGLQNLASRNNLDQNMLSGFGRFGALGANLLGQAQDTGVQNLGMGLNAGQIQQGYDQSLIDADKAKWDFEQNAELAHIQNQLGTIPGPGGYSVTPGADPFAMAMQGMQTGLGIYGAGKDAGWWGGGGGHIGSGWDNPFGTGSTPGEVGYIDF